MLLVKHLKYGYQEENIKDVIQYTCMQYSAAWNPTDGSKQQ